MKKKILFICLLFIFIFVFSVKPMAEAYEISLGKDYTLITQASNAYPDENKKLTDGIYGTMPDGSDNYYSSKAYVGFNKSDLDQDGNFVIILDLGKSYSDIKSFTVGYLNETGAGISAPKSISFSISNERNNGYTEMGTVTTKIEYTEVPSTFAKTLEVANGVGRYVKITITPDQYGEENEIANWTFIDEIAVHAESFDQDNSEEISIPEITETPETGDNDFTVFGFILLGIAALSMAVVLFAKTLFSKKY